MNTEFSFLNKEMYHNTMEEWIIAFSIILFTIVIARLAYLLLSRVLKVFTGKTKTKLDDLLVQKLETPAVFLIILIGLNFALERLHFGVKLELYVHRSFIFLTTISITWFLVRVAYALIEEYLRPYSQRSGSNMDEQVVMLTERGSGILLWMFGIIAGLNNAGFDVGALIAGLGIGGLALALAAQDTVKNIFGGLMVFLDKPFKLGDRIKIGDFDGFVDYIGIRSTRLRTLENRIVTIPNAQFGDSPIENITVEPSRKIITKLGLEYDTSPEKLEEAMRILKVIATECPLVHSDEIHIFFENLNAYSLDIKFIYFIKKESDILQAQNDINLEILRRFNASGLSFAFPSQTIYKKELQ